MNYVYGNFGKYMSAFWQGRRFHCGLTLGLSNSTGYIHISIGRALGLGVDSGEIRGWQTL